MKEFFYYQICACDEIVTKVLWESEDGLDGEALLGCPACIENHWMYKEWKAKREAKK
jgi:hypothetical protein